MDALATDVGLLLFTLAGLVATFVAIARDTPIHAARGARTVTSALLPGVQAEEGPAI